MRAQTLLSVVAAAATASAQSSSAIANAPVATGNPAGASYLATLPAKAGTTVRGTVAGASSPDGKGVLFQVAISGLPAEGGPFMYHIHEKPVPADGNCTGTGAHLDPYKRGEVPICDATKPETCQTGDLSGKFGNITAQSWTQTYTDLYSATNPSNAAYFGNLSVVVHLSNKTRISCANFTVQAPGAGISSLPVSVGTSSGYAAPTGGFNHTLSHSATATGTGGAGGNQPTTGSPIAPSSPPQNTNAAGKVAGGAGVVAAALAALVL